MTDVQEVLIQTDLLALVEQAGATPKRYRDGYRCECPLHGGGNSTAFSIFPDAKGELQWKCFADCNDGGDAIDFVRRWRGLDFRGALEFLGGNQDKIDPVELEKIAAARAAREQAKLAEQAVITERALEDLRGAEMDVYYYEHAEQWMRDLWRTRGISEEWQAIYRFGGTNEFRVFNSSHGEYTSPTLTIPVYDERHNLVTLRHRVIKPVDKGDKYRPEKSGLGAHPFLGLPELGYDGDMILVVEGEIKAAVLFSIIGSIDIQVIGASGQTVFSHLTDRLKGKNVVVCPDPDAVENAVAFAKSVGGRYFMLPGKIDDYILETQADKNDIYNFVKHARKA